ncbi:unnamed protein product [Peronospora effusa]|nr:unnamed protein product [Peronospora effusa]
MIMLALLATAKTEPKLAALRNRAILLLDYTKSVRHGRAGIPFLGTRALWIFSCMYGDDPEKMYHDSLCDYNRTLSEAQEMISGIRQGGLHAFSRRGGGTGVGNSTRHLIGLKMPGGRGADEKHKFRLSSTIQRVFMQEAQHLPRVMTIVEKFGRMSGLKA